MGQGEIRLVDSGRQAEGPPVDVTVDIQQLIDGTSHGQGCRTVDGVSREVGPHGGSEEDGGAWSRGPQGSLRNGLDRVVPPAYEVSHRAGRRRRWRRASRLAAVHEDAHAHCAAIGRQGIPLDHPAAPPGAAGAHVDRRRGSGQFSTQRSDGCHGVDQSRAELVIAARRPQVLRRRRQQASDIDGDTQVTGSLEGDRGDSCRVRRRHGRAVLRRVAVTRHRRDDAGPWRRDIDR